MIDIINEAGSCCVTLDLVCLDGLAWAIPVLWHTDIGGLPDPHSLEEGLETILARGREAGARFIDCRVQVAGGTAGDHGLQDARADRLREVLRHREFIQGEGRLELRLPLGDAQAALRGLPAIPVLDWECLDSGDMLALNRAALLLQQATIGDPGSHPEDDALGFLLAFRDDCDGTLAPECLQIGYHAGTPAALLALRVDPASGWCSIHYLAVVPGKRGLGIGRQAFRHGLDSLAILGGREYHDGTGEHNLPARALLDHLGNVPCQRLEEWRLQL